MSVEISETDLFQLVVSTENNDKIKSSGPSLFGDCLLISFQPQHHFLSQRPTSGKSIRFIGKLSQFLHPTRLTTTALLRCIGEISV